MQNLSHWTTREAPSLSFWGSFLVSWSLSHLDINSCTGAGNAWVFRNHLGYHLIACWSGEISTDKEVNKSGEDMAMERCLRQRKWLWARKSSFKAIIQKDTCTPLFRAAVFTIGKTWNCPSTDKWIKKMWYIYTMEYYSTIKKNEIMPFVSNMDGPRCYHTKWSKSEWERQIPYDITYKGNLKSDTNEFIYKRETDSQTWRTGLWLTKGGRDGLEVWT